MIKAPMGLDAFTEAVESACGSAEDYKRGGRRKPFFIAELKAGNGQHTALRFAADCFRESGIAEFSNRDTHLFFKAENSPESIGRIFDSIEQSTVYTNEYDGCVGIDIGALSGHMNDEAYRILTEKIVPLASQACIILFVPSLTGKDKALADKLRVQLDCCMEVIPFTPYSPLTCAGITVSCLQERNVKVNDCMDVSLFLENIIEEESITSASGAALLADDLVHYADYSGREVIVDLWSAERFCMERREKNELRTLVNA